MSAVPDTPVASGIVLGTAWPAFLSACLLELLVFALVDPQDLSWAGESLPLSRTGVYTAAFFLFWIVSGVGCGLTAILSRPHSS